MSGISNLRSERYRLGMSQEELGELVGRRARHHRSLGKRPRSNSGTHSGAAFKEV